MWHACSCNVTNHHIYIGLRQVGMLQAAQPQKDPRAPTAGGTRGASRRLVKFKGEQGAQVLNKY